MHCAPIKQQASYKPHVYVIFITATIIIWLVYFQSVFELNDRVIIDYSFSGISNYSLVNSSTDLAVNYTSASEYLVWSTKCQIPDINPFADDIKPFFHPNSYKSCRKYDLLTYIVVKDNVATLFINKTVAPLYSKIGVVCCYRNVTRGSSKSNPDSVIETSSCQEFVDNATLFIDTVTVKCYPPKKKSNVVYDNVHTAITITKNVQKKLGNPQSTFKNPLSVLILGIDSISRLNFIRSMPKTHSYLEKNDWVEMQGYNKIGDNTFPNLMAILTGRNSSNSYDVCKPKQTGMLDECNIIWFKYRDLGYVTIYSEDEGLIGTFNYLKKGFLRQPTDYYTRPYILAAEKFLKVVRVDEMKYCVGPETSGERILNIAEDFTQTFKNASYFGLFWMNSFSHNKINSASRMDDKVLKLLERLSKENTFDNTIVLFLSDHGMRFGDMRSTYTGWLEERLPFFYIKLPKWFSAEFPEEYSALKHNTNKLTTPYDLHMTLQHVLVLSGRNYTIRASEGCPNCKSLFEPIEKERSCSDVAIQQHWCTCRQYKSVNPFNETVKAAAGFIVKEIAKELGKDPETIGKCSEFTVKQIMSSRMSTEAGDKDRHFTFLLLIVQTDPEAVFEGTVRLEVNKHKYLYSLQGKISRLDYYSEHSKCVNDAETRKYCYCN